mgnify:CR=1 FL=1
MFYAIVICGPRVLRVLYGPLPVFLCNIAGFLNGCAILFAAITVTMYTFARFMFVCIWKRMRQMDDNLIVRIATIQAIVLSLLFQAATWFQLQGQETIPVSFFHISAIVDNTMFQRLKDVNQSLMYSRVWNRRRAGNKRRAWKIGQKE